MNHSAVHLKLTQYVIAKWYVNPICEFLKKIFEILL